MVDTAKLEASGDGRTTAPRLTWLLPLLLLAAIIVVHLLQPQFRRESQGLVSLLYTLFCAAPAILVVFLAGHSFLATGSCPIERLGGDTCPGLGKTVRRITCLAAVFRNGSVGPLGSLRLVTVGNDAQKAAVGLIGKGV